MIDYWNLLANSLWILGLATLLATLSWSHWRASEENVKFRTILARRKVRQALDLGLCLFCAGLAATASSWLERILWGVLAIAWFVQVCLAQRKTTTE